MGQAGRHLTAGGQGALAGGAAGCIYGGYVVFLGEDLRHGFLRLATERMALASTLGCLTGILLSLLCLTGLMMAARRGRKTLLLVAALIALSVVSFSVLAAFPFREEFFPLHQFSSPVATLLLFCALGAILAALCGWRILEALRQSREEVSRGRKLASRGGWVLALLSAGTLAAAPRLGLARGVSGRGIIILSLDTLRADRLGVLGCARDLTPRLDRLAKEGAVFEQATSTAPWTLPSHASLFTSQLPYTCGVRDEHRPLAPRLATLAERLSNAGYRSAAFTGGGYVSAGFGFSQGFEIYQEHDESKEGGSEPIARAALEWIRQRRGKPFFAFVHTYQIHFPYNRDEFVPPEERASNRPLTLEDLEAIHQGDRVLTSSERETIRDRYDGGVAWADRIMGGMLESLREEGILDQTILVILSDHGEDLWDHDQRRSPGHGHSLYQELLRVPLIIRAPGLARPASSIRTPVSLVDVVPTLEEMVGLPRLGEEEGSSLAQTLRTGEEPPSKPVLSEATEYGPDRFARREGDLKLVLTPLPQARSDVVAPPPRPLEIYRLDTDPRESSDLSLDAPAASEVAEKLWRHVEQVYRPLREPGVASKLPPELQEQLRSLGYVR